MRTAETASSDLETMPWLPHSRTVQRADAGRCTAGPTPCMVLVQSLAFVGEEPCGTSFIELRTKMRAGGRKATDQESKAMT